MGIDWETILGSEGADMADAYDDYVESYDYDDSDRYEYKDEDEECDIDRLLEIYKVKISGNVVAYFEFNLRAADNYTFFCNDHCMIVNNHVVTIDGHSYCDHNYNYSIRNNSSINSKFDIDGNEFVDFKRNETDYISINGFTCKKPEIQNDIQSQKRYKELRAAFSKSCKIDEYDAENYNIAFGSGVPYEDKVLDMEDDHYYIESFYEDITDDGKKIVYYDENICLEYTDDDNKEILFIGDYSCCERCFSGYVMVKYTDENGRPVIEINGSELSEYDENGRHIVRINGYELVTYEENGETVGFINGVKCENADEAAEKNDLPKEDLGDIITEKFIEAKAEPKQTAPCDNCSGSNGNLDDLPF